METANKENKQLHDQVQEQAPEQPQPIQPSRAQFDFQGDAPVQESENLSETERKLQQLESEGEAVSESTEEQPQQSQEETKPQSDSNLPSLEELDLPSDVGLPDEPQQPAELPDTPEAKKFAEDFQKYLGFSVEEFRQASQDYQQTINYINQVRQEQYRNQAQQSLAKDWGIDQAEVAGRLEQVRERFEKYPKDMQDRLDSVEGAKLIWAKIEQEQGLQKEVPQFQRSSQRTAPRQQPMFTQYEIDNMSREEYARNADKILRAYQLGLVQ